MTVTDQLKIIDNKIKANQAQYDLDRLAAKISAYSSGDLRKYEYLTGEDLGYKPSVFEQAKFDYSPLGNIFTKGFDKDDKKEGLFKRIENIKDKNEELLNVFSATNKVSKAAKNESDFNYDSRYGFYKFDRDFENFKKIISIDLKRSKLIEFYKLLSDFKNYKLIKPNKYFDTKKYHGENLNERDEIFFDPNQLKLLGKKKQKSKLTEESMEIGSLKKKLRDRKRERGRQRERERAAKTIMVWNKQKRNWKINKRHLQ